MEIMISGASGGVGNYLTKYFDKSNNKLILTYNEHSVIYKPKYAKFELKKCDFTNEDCVKELYNNLKQIDVLINTIATVDNALVRNMSLESWHNVISSNLNTVFLACKYALPKMAFNSHIINFSSVLGTTGIIGASNYAAAKGGVEAFTKSLALEAIRDKIFVNTIALGYFETGLGKRLPEKVRNNVIEKIPLKKFGDPMEICHLVDFIIHSTYIVGQIIHINGGLYI